MTIYDQLPDVQREVLRQVFRAPDHVATQDTIKAHCYYPDAQIEQAVRDLIATGHLFPIGDSPTTYVPSADMLVLMQGKRAEADAELRQALDQAKPFLRDGDES